MECPDNIVSGNLKVKIKDGSNPWWAAYQVTNAKNPINGMSMSTDGGATWVKMAGPGLPAPSGFWFMKPDGLILNSDNGMENYKIRVESDTGEIIVDMVGVVASSETDSGTNNGGGENCSGQGGQGGQATAPGPAATTAGPAATTAAHAGASGWKVYTLSNILSDHNWIMFFGYIEQIALCSSIVDISHT